MNLRSPANKDNTEEFLITSNLILENTILEGDEIPVHFTCINKDFKLIEF